MCNGIKKINFNFFKRLTVELKIRYIEIIVASLKGIIFKKNFSPLLLTFNKYDIYSIDNTFRKVLQVNN